MRIHVKIILIAVSILIATLLLSAFLSRASFEKLFVNSLLSTNYALIGKHLKLEIEWKALQRFKALEDYTAIDEHLAAFGNTPGLESIKVVTPGGEILFGRDRNGLEWKSGDEATLGESENRILEEAIAAFGQRQELFEDPEGNRYLFPLYDYANTLSGAIVLSFSESFVRDELHKLATRNVHLLGMILLGATSLIVALAVVVVGRPLGKDLLQIDTLLRWPPSAAPPGMLEASAWQAPRGTPKDSAHGAPIETPASPKSNCEVAETGRLKALVFGLAADARLRVCEAQALDRDWETVVQLYREIGVIESEIGRTLSAEGEGQTTRHPQNPRDLWVQSTAIQARIRKLVDEVSS